MSIPIRVLVVDDSSFMRRTIRHLLTADPDLEVVGEAGDGMAAVRAVEQLRPDVVTMDVNMPRTDGLAAVERIMAERPTPIVMLSSYTQGGSDATIRALQLGAVDCVAKPSASLDLDLVQVRDELLRKLRVAARLRMVRSLAAPRPEPTTPVLPIATPHPASSSRSHAGVTPCVVIAASTGGPAALLDLLPRLPHGLPASLLIVQHMPAPYTGELAAMLAARCGRPVREAQRGDRLERGTALVAPGAFDVQVLADGRIQLSAPARFAEGCPSADIALRTASEACGGAVIAVVLTGMGRDGSAGVRCVREAGGRVIAQDEATSLVHGMPRAAIETGCVDRVLPLGEIALAISESSSRLGATRQEQRSVS